MQKIQTKGSEKSATRRTPGFGLTAGSLAFARTAKNTKIDTNSFSYGAVIDATFATITVRVLVLEFPLLPPTPSHSIFRAIQKTAILHASTEGRQGKC